uniref:4-coumarate--CoA ligase n=1 Tax=Parascaris univalens TaxID=6257 RepID=A0A915ARH8_PARUN
MPIKSQLADIEIPHIPFHDLIIDSLKKYGTNVALINHDTNETFTFAEIISKTKYIANSLVSLGIEKGEAVILCVPNCPDFAWLFLGISMAGGIVCPLHPTFSIDEMRLQISDSAARFAFAVPSALSNLSAVFCELDIVHRIVCVGNRKESEGYPIISDLALSSAACSSGFPETYPDDDIVFLPYSSGTSGPRKGVAISHYALNAMLKIFNNIDAYELPRAGEHTIGRMCFHDAFGRDALFSSLMNGATTVTTNASDESLAECLEKYKVRVLFLNPLILRKLCSSEIATKYSLSSLKAIIIGTAAADDETMKVAYKFLSSVRRYSSVYGMTEMGSVCRSTKSSSFNIHSCGSLCANLSMKVVDLFTGRELGPNERGLILISGPTVISPYWNNQKATMEDFKYSGWRNTGDIGYYDKYGNVFLVDRVKQMIKVNGYQVTPQELESILISHPCVAEAAVVPAKIINEGEMPFAFVVLRSKMSTTPEDIMEFVNGRVSPYKRLMRVVIALTIPRSPSGRILRRMLREAASLYI